MSKLHLTRLRKPHRPRKSAVAIDKSKMPWVRVVVCDGSKFVGRLGTREGNVVTLYDAETITDMGQRYSMPDGVILAFTIMLPER
jgi:hypothetical protein